MSITKIGGALQATVDSVAGALSSNISKIGGADWTTSGAPTQLSAPTGFEVLYGRDMIFQWDVPIAGDDAYVGSWEIWGGTDRSSLLASISHTAGSTTDNTYIVSLAAGTYFYKIMAISNGTPADSVMSDQIDFIVS